MVDFKRWIYVNVWVYAALSENEKWGVKTYGLVWVRAIPMLTQQDALLAIDSIFVCCVNFNNPAFPIIQVGILRNW